MRVWLLTVGEPLPSDDRIERLWRTGMLADQLGSRGHDVVWWSSAFDHLQRVTRAPIDRPVNAAPGLTVWHLGGRAYRRNISLARVLNHHQVARRFRHFALQETRPDVILSSLPTLELCCEAVAYGAAHRVPVALDVRDLWPDVLVDVVPEPMRGAARTALWWMRAQHRRATRGAAAILGITDEFVRWGLAGAGRAPRAGVDRAFPMGYTAIPPSAHAIETADRFWAEQGLDGQAQSIVCFFGTVGWMFDFDTVFTAANRLRDLSPNVVFVICGSGERYESLRARAAQLPNVRMPGRVGAAEIWALMRRSMAGLAPYRPLKNFDDNFPNKLVEYMSAGLPIVGSELTTLRAAIEAHECGATYAHGDADALARVIHGLAARPSQRMAMGARARALYQRHFVAEVVYRDMAAHLERLGAPGTAVGGYAKRDIVGTVRTLGKDEWAS